jgi:hypothetical protein
MYLATKNDVDGNPRRGWVILEAYSYNMEGSHGGCTPPLAWVEEGYGGRQELRERFPNAVELPRVNVTPAEWREWRKAAQGAERNVA